MRGKKKHKRRRPAGLAPTNPIQRPQVELREVVDMYTSLQPGRLGTQLYFFDFSGACSSSALVYARVIKVIQRSSQPLGSLIKHTIVSALRCQKRIRVA